MAQRHTFKAKPRQDTNAYVAFAGQTPEDHDHDKTPTDAPFSSSTVGDRLQELAMQRDYRVVDTNTGNDLDAFFGGVFAAGGAPQSSEDPLTPGSVGLKMEDHDDTTPPDQLLPFLAPPTQHDDGEDSDEEYDESDHELVAAVKMGHADRVSELLSRGGPGVTANMTDAAGNSVLHYACFHLQSAKHQKIVELLLKHGASVTAADAEEQTPLHWAARVGDSKTCKMLLDYGADIEQRDKRGYTAMHHAAQANHGLLCYVLHKRGLAIDCRDHEGHTPLHWAVYEGYQDLIRFLISLGASVNKQDNNGFSALHWACVMGNREAARSVIEAGSDPRLKDTSGKTPFELAWDRGMFSVVEELERYAEYYRAKASPGGRRKLAIMWYIIGWLFIWTPYFLLASFPLWLGVSIFASLNYAAYVLLGNLWPGVEDYNSFFLAMFKMGWHLATFTWYYYVLEVTHTLWWETRIFFVLNWTATILYCYLSWVADPGIVRSTPNNGLDWLVERLETGQKVPKYCPTCLVAKPFRSKHCRACNVCIVKMDHHCPWMATCLGQRTHRTFIVLIVNLVALHVFFHRFCYLYLISLESTPNQFWPLYNTLHLFYQGATFVFLIMLSNLTSLVGDVQLLWQTHADIGNHMTTNEAMNVHKYDHFWTDENGETHNPYNMGYGGNVAAWLFNTIDWSQIYFLEAVPINNGVPSRRNMDV